MKKKRVLFGFFALASFLLLNSCGKSDESNVVKDYIEKPRQKALDVAEAGEQRAEDLEDRLNDFNE